MKLSRTIEVVFFIGVLFLSGVVGINNVALAQGSKTFNNPTIGGYRLDWCLHWGTQCGKPAGIDMLHPQPLQAFSQVDSEKIGSA